MSDKISKLISCGVVNLRLVAEGVVLPATTGQCTLQKSRGLFQDTFFCTDYEFREMGSKLDHPTDEILTDVYEIREAVTPKRLFGCFGRAAEEYSFTQDQVVQWCEANPDLLGRGQSRTIIPFKAGDGLFIAVVSKSPDDTLRLEVDTMWSGTVYHETMCHYIVFPKKL